MKTAKIITYPRSGANYLQNLLFNRTGNRINYFHEVDWINEFDDVIITIARDPFDSIHSNVTMRKHYYPKESFNSLHISQYLDIYNFSYEKSDIVIDYKDLINQPKQVLAKVCELLEIKEIFEGPDIEFLKDNKKFSYLVSSKTSKEYANKHFDIEDISECYEPYNRLLSKALDLTKP